MFHQIKICEKNPVVLVSNVNHKTFCLKSILPILIHIQIVLEDATAMSNSN